MHGVPSSRDDLLGQFFQLVSFIIQIVQDYERPFLVGSQLPF